MRSFLVSVALLPSLSFAGQLYVCTDGAGKKSFQEMPCSGAVTSEVREYEVREIVPSQSQGLATDSDYYKEMKADNRRAQLNRDIKRSENKLKRYQASMSKELAGLKAKKSRANNNLAGAQWESSISTEMQAVSEKYKNLMDSERSNLDRYRDELASL